MVMQKVRNQSISYCHTDHAAQALQMENLMVTSKKEGFPTFEETALKTLCDQAKPCKTAKQQTTFWLAFVSMDFLLRCSLKWLRLVVLSISYHASSIPNNNVNS